MLLIKNRFVKYDFEVDTINKEINIKVVFNIYRLILFSVYYFYKFDFVKQSFSVWVGE